jgi:hypothetical protein
MDRGFEFSLIFFQNPTALRKSRHRNCARPTYRLLVAVGGTGD